MPNMTTLANLCVLTLLESVPYVRARVVCLLWPWIFWSNLSSVEWHCVPKFSFLLLLVHGVRQLAIEHLSRSLGVEVDIEEWSCLRTWFCHSLEYLVRAGSSLMPWVSSNCWYANFVLWKAKKYWSFVFSEFSGRRISACDKKARLISSKLARVPTPSMARASLRIVAQRRLMRACIPTG